MARRSSSSTHDDHNVTSVHNAIQCLLQNDSESALVYALVHDPEFKLTFAILKIATDDKDRDIIIKALIHVFEPHEEEFHRFMRALMVQEMVETENWNDLFRAKSSVTALVREYTCQLGHSFLFQALQPTISTLWDMQAVTFEVNPHMLMTETTRENANRGNNRPYLEEILRKNRRQLHRITQQVLDDILAVTSSFPRPIAKLYQILKQEMVRILLEERKRSSSITLTKPVRSDSIDDTDIPINGRRRQLSIDVPERVSFRDRKFSYSDYEFVLTTEDAQDEVMIHLGGFVFLRYICPALLMPQQFSLTPDQQIPSRYMRRNLVLMAKILQSLASAVEYGAHESYMTPFNGFLGHNRSRLAQFYRELLDIANDRVLSREKDKFGWSRNSISSNTSTVDEEMEEIAGSSFMRSFRTVLLQNLPVIASDMEQTHMKLEEQRRMAAGAAVTSIIAQRQMRQRRAQKSDNTQTQTDSDPNQIPTPTATRLQLEHWVHQQKQYQSKLKANFRPSRQGLSSLLKVNDSTEWKHYKTHKSSIQIFRRKSPAHGFVEMKACVTIQASSRQVFRYLRSLESMTEWDERASTIEKMDILNDSSVLLYRSQPKLSLWPSWLVKPRDSCDLHTFVSETGRDKVHAVVMESVPNPEFPELKGVVRMSYATGGFLMEPCTGPLTETGTAVRPIQHIDLDEVLEQWSTKSGDKRNSILDACQLSREEDVTPSTRLTCVVCADFKGSLPRSLAEGICYRQVLSVEAIKKHVEAELAHLRSQWV